MSDAQFTSTAFRRATAQRSSRDGVPPGVTLAFAAFALVLGFFLAIDPQRSWSGAVLALAFAVLLGLTGFWRLQARRSARPVRLDVDAEGLHLDGALAARRDDVVAAYVMPAPNGDEEVVVERRRGARLLLRTDDHDAASALVAALGKSAADAAVTFRVHGGFGEHVRQLAGFAGVAWTTAAFFLRGHAGAVTYALLALAAVVAVLNLVPTRIVVGADGLHVRGPLRRRFVPWSRVDAVTTEANGDVVLALVSGELVRVHTRVEDRRSQNLVHKAIAWRIEEALSVYRAARGGSAEALVARGGRDVAAWREALRALGDGASYRGPAVPEDELVRIVEDPRAAPPARVGAAVALRASPSAEAVRVRVAQAAEATAEPKLRVALARALEDDDALELLDEADAADGDGAEGRAGRTPVR